MEKPNAPARALRFGASWVDLQAGELRKNGRKIRLPEQPFQILALLLERPGEVVTREELRQKLWPADTFVDFDHGLNNAINRLREVLNDSAENPRYIETLPRRGYRFIHPVESAVAQIRRPAAWWRRSWAISSSLLILGAAVLGGVLATNSGGLRERLFTSAAHAPIKRLAVLPLANLTGNPEQDYLADGIHEALTTELARVGGLEVVSRTSVMRYKKTEKSVPEIAQELKVDAVVEGALLASGQRVQVTAQLIRANPERHLWADKLDRDAQDILVLYSDLTRAIVGAVQAKLTSQEQARLASVRKVAPAVYKLELRGRFYLEKGSTETDSTAVNFFEKAIQLDPSYALAYQGLAAAYWRLGLGSFVPPKAAYARAKAAALKAVELDDSLSQAHHVLGQISYLYEWDWEGAEREFERVRQLDSTWEGPNLFLCLTGRFEQAIAASRRQLEFDPYSAKASHNLGFMYFWAGRYDEAIAQQKRTLELDPDRPYSRSQIGWAYAKKGMYPQAVAECDEAIRQLGEREDQELLGHCGWVYAFSGRRDKALEIVQRLRHLAPRRSVNPVHFAKMYDGLGDHERAIRFLNQAFEERSPLMAHLKTDPMYSDQLRANPRFQELLRRVGPPQR